MNFKLKQFRVQQLNQTAISFDYFRPASANVKKSVVEKCHEVTVNTFLDEEKPLIVKPKPVGYNNMETINNSGQIKKAIAKMGEEPKEKT